MTDYLSLLANIEEGLIIHILLLAESPEFTRVNKRFREIYVRNENRLIVSHVGVEQIIYKLFGIYHRNDDLPAIIRANGTQEWHQYGKIHRDNDLPAIIYADGYREWYQYGKCHRDNDLPAVICADGTQEWYQHGKCHRDNDMPAVVYADGTQEWYQYGKLVKSL